MSVVATTLSVDFGPSSIGSLELYLFNSYVGQGYSALKLVDTVPTGTLQLFADVGSVEFFKNSAEQINAKIELVQNIDKIYAPFGETITVLWAVGSDGVFSPALTFNAAGKYYSTGTTMSGIIKRSSYTRPFQILRYKPKFSGIGLGWSIEYGVVAAVKEAKAALIQTEIPNQDEYAQEAYRIYSEVLVNSEGEWEKPIGWPSTPSYAGDVKPVPEADNGVLVERVHEIGVITSKVTSHVRNYSISHSKPFATSSSYQPVKLLKVGNTNGMSSDQRLYAAEVVSRRRLFTL